jgi:hypothetical protein
MGFLVGKTIINAPFLESKKNARFSGDERWRDSEMSHSTEAVPDSAPSAGMN